MGTPIRCGHWIGDEDRFCHSTHRVRLHSCGLRCPQHTPPAEPPTRTSPRLASAERQTFAWRCAACGITGPADSADHASALNAMHDAFACPTTAPTAVEYANRVGRRADLTRAYPEQAPPWPADRPFPKETRAMLDAALALAAEGIPVFWLGRTKRPVANCPDCPKAETDPSHDPQACPCLTCHGFYAATTGPARIAAAQQAVPGGLLAIRTGAVSNRVVIDIDPRNGGKVIPELMPPTRCARSGSGGWHLHYRHPGGPLAGKLRGHPGIDVKADGGYVVAPPSIHPGTRQPYRWIGNRAEIEMPPPLIAACRPAEPPTAGGPSPAPTPTSNGRGISSAPALLAAHLDAIARAPEGRRRTTLYGAARGVARMVAAGALTGADAYTALYDAGRAAQQTHRDIHAAITGGFHAESVATEGIAA
ncbi:bifunctional DNA primase/polymerase [Actinoplanes sp. NPDC051861]|uniref:bifunctional DNA primase/polymerase n=1 Tax=Actinoplanes sp. NPDC051861 TaxID=3155170 RepID=UPI003448811D